MWVKDSSCKKCENCKGDFRCFDAVIIADFVVVYFVGSKQNIYVRCSNYFVNNTFF